MCLSEEGIAIATNRTLQKLGITTTPKKVYTYDGKSENLESFQGISEHFTYALISNNAPSLTTITRVVGVFEGRGTMEIPREGLSITSYGAERVEVASMEDAGMQVGLIVNVMGSLYVVSTPGMGYVSQVEFSVATEETTTPIDPKYLPGVCLPGVCLPVVELSTVGTSDGAVLTAEESAKMEEVSALGLPIIVKAMIGGAIPASGVYSYANMGYPVFTATSSGMQFTVAKIEGIWVFMQT